MCCEGVVAAETTASTGRESPSPRHVVCHEHDVGEVHSHVKRGMRSDLHASRATHTSRAYGSLPDAASVDALMIKPPPEVQSSPVLNLVKYSTWLHSSCLVTLLNDSPAEAT